ncbi:MAG: succinate--CoA ligase subunit alpha [Candidatus Micrarchaeota archaeon]
MSILINKNTKVLIQGITGREASKVCGEMQAYGTKVLAGVTPGKGGQEVNGVPVYNTVKEALANNNGINASVVYVPPFAAKDACLEAMANGIKLLNVITERIPILDTSIILAEAKKQNAIVVGPTSVGIINPGECKLGPIGGNNPDRIFKKGNVAVVSKSGSMTNETSWLLRQAGYGQSIAMGIGGDVLAGFAFPDALLALENDKETKAIVLFGELGGTYEEQAAEIIKQKKVTKPVVAFVAGMFADYLPKSMQLGHAGAIIEGSTGSPQAKKTALANAGVLVADAHHEIVDLLKTVVKP